MRTRVLGVVVLAVLASVPASPADARQRCAASGSKTLEATERARVFRWQATSPDSYEVYGCLYRRNRRLKLDFNQTEDDPYGPYVEIRLITLAGRHVAWVNDWSERPGRRTTVNVVDLRSGRKMHSWTGGGEQFGYYTPGWETDHRHVYSTTDLVVKPSGAVAWIAWTRVGEPYRDYEYTIYKSDATGEGILLDSGVNLDKDSLALSGSTIYWTKDGRAHSATLY